MHIAKLTPTALSNHALQTLFPIFVSRRKTHYHLRFAIPPVTPVSKLPGNKDMGFPFAVGELRNIVFPFIM